MPATRGLKNQTSSEHPVTWTSGNCWPSHECVYATKFHDVYACAGACACVCTRDRVCVCVHERAPGSRAAGT